MPYQLAGQPVVPAADGTNNATIADAVGNKSDATQQGPNTTRSLVSYTKGVLNALTAAGGIAVFPAASAPANAISIAGALREVYDQSEKAAVKAAATMVNGQTAFTIAGGPIEIEALLSLCVTANDATASTLQYQANPTVGTATTISGATASLASATAGSTILLTPTALSTAPVIVLAAAGGVQLGGNIANRIVIPAGTISLVVGVGSTTGTWSHHIRYKPLARGVTVT